MMNKKNESLADKFNVAADKLYGPMTLITLGNEAVNLCEKFELLWDAAADDKEQKRELLKSFMNHLYKQIDSIKTEKNALAIDARASVVTKMFNALQKVCPHTKSNELCTYFQGQAAALAKMSAAELKDMPRLSWARAADTLTLMANAIQPVPPPAPEPEPAVLPKEPAPSFSPIMDPELRRAIRHLSP